MSKPGLWIVFYLFSLGAPLEDWKFIWCSQCGKKINFSITRLNGSKSFSCIIYLLNYEGSKADGEHKRLRDEGNNCLQTKKSWIHRQNQFTSSGHSFNSFWISSWFPREIHTAIITISQIFIAAHEKSVWIKCSWRMWDLFYWIFLLMRKF